MLTNDDIQPDQDGILSLVADFAHALTRVESEPAQTAMLAFAKAAPEQNIAPVPEVQDSPAAQLTANPSGLDAERLSRRGAIRAIALAAAASTRRSWPVRSNGSRSISRHQTGLLLAAPTCYHPTPSKHVTEDPYRALSPSFTSIKVDVESAEGQRVTSRSIHRSPDAL